MSMAHVCCLSGMSAHIFNAMYSMICQCICDVMRNDQYGWKHFAHNSFCHCCIRYSCALPRSCTLYIQLPVFLGLNVWWWPRLCVSATTSSTLERKSKIYICENGEELDVLFWVEIMFTARCIECKHKARIAVLCVCGGALHGFAFTCIIDDDLCFWPWFMQEFEFEIRWCSLGSFCRIDYLESLRFVFSLNEQKSCKKENFSAWKLNHTLVVMFCQTNYFARKIFCVLHRFLRSNECASTVAAPLISRR